MTQTTKILNKTVENIVLSSVLESIKGIKGNKRFFKKLKTLSEKDKNKLWESKKSKAEKSKAADDVCVCVQWRFDR